LSSVISYKPSAEDVKRLREQTGAGMIDCRNALVRAGGDYEAAKRELGELGQSAAAKKDARVAKEGVIVSYIHHNSKAGVLLELNCETDFVARNERFAKLAHDVAKQVFATEPAFVDRASVPPEKLAEVRAELERDMPAGKSAEVTAKIIEGKLNKWYGDHVLLDQPFIMDEDQTVGELIAAVVGLVGEKIAVRRFAKFTLGED
jgi:elongation factor Ts